MNILVCISIVPDTTSKLVIDSSNGKIDKRGLTMIAGPYDDYALSKAVELKEANQGNLVVLHVGNDPSAEAILRKCLAIGADEAYRIETEARSSRQVANEIIHFAKDRSFDLVMMGKESIDSNAAIVHKLVANGLGIKHFNPVMQLELKSANQIEIKLEVENGTANLQVDLPAVLGCQEPIAEWKIPSMRGIMMARTKPLQVVSPAVNNGVSHFSDVVIEKNRLQKILKPENIKEVAEIINQIIK